jgi:excisionase family DNA binding protein
MAADADLLTVSEAAERLRISTGLAYELIRQERLPHVHLGRRVLVPVAALDEWVVQETQRVRVESNRLRSWGFA